MIIPGEEISRLNKWQLYPDFRTDTQKQFRDLFLTIKRNYMDKDISISISGLRRTGKTTILNQLINHLLDNRFAPSRILYFQFSDTYSDLTGILELFFSRYNDAQIGKDSFYIFLDELQYVDNWQSILKNYIDRNKKIRFIITGSASIYFRSKTRESLAGRILDFRLEPLSFGEMIRLQEGRAEKYNLLDLMKGRYSDPTAILKEIIFERQTFVKLLNKYLLFGEYPALLPYLDDYEYCRKYLLDGIIDKILTQDIRLFEVEKQEEIYSLFKICCSNTAQMINLKNLASETGLSYPTIKKYLSVLKKTYLIDTAKNRLRSVRAQMKSLDKVFLTSVNLLTSMLAITDPLNPPYLDFKGHIIESFVYNSVKRLGNVFYFHKSGKEVDLVIESGSRLIPIEVKSSSHVKKTDLNHLWDYLEKNSLDNGYLFYGGDVKLAQKDGKKIHLLPYYLL